MFVSIHTGLAIGYIKYLYTAFPTFHVNGLVRVLSTDRNYRSNPLFINLLFNLFIKIIAFVDLVRDVVCVSWPVTAPT